MKIKKIFIVLLFLLQNCGYTPIHSEYQNFDYRLNIIEIKGEPMINNLISSKLKKLSNNKAKKTIDLKISSDSERLILSKNKQNEITYYQLVQSINFEITDEKDFEKQFNFNEKIKIRNINDQFEMKKYQDEIIKSFINSKIDEFILQLKTIK